MADPISIEVLEARFAGLRDWLDERFRRLDDQLAAMADAREGDCQRLEKLERKVLQNHEQRLMRLERLAWLMAGVAALMSPIAVWAMIEIIKQLTGL